jgi:hypothetical protein
MHSATILPPSKRRCADLAREAKASGSRIVILRDRLVMIPRKETR